MTATDFDTVLVTPRADLAILTGYDMIWYHLQNVTGTLVRADPLIYTG